MSYNKTDDYFGEAGTFAPKTQKKEYAYPFNIDIDFEKEDFALSVLIGIPEFWEEGSNFVEKEYGGSYVKTLNRYGLKIGERIGMGRFQIEMIN